MIEFISDPSFQLGLAFGFVIAVFINTVQNIIKQHKEEDKICI